MKKKTALFITVIISMFVFCLSAGAVFDERPYSEKDYKIIDNVVYALDEDGKSYYVEDYFATQEAANAATEINIAGEIDGIPVTKIYVWHSEADSVYMIESLPNIKKITIPDSITKIEVGAFACLDGVETIEIPESVEYIGPAAFYKMDSLKSIIIPSKVTEIGEMTFTGCKKLKTAELKGDVTAIGSYAFSGCKKLSEINIPATVEAIGDSAFEKTALTSVTLPGDVDFKGQNDGAGAFSNCKKLKKVVFTNCKAQRLDIEMHTFRGCTALEKVYLPKSVKKITIDTGAFLNCKSLKKVYNTANIVLIDDFAFRGCKSLKNFTISGKTEEIGKKAFYGCTSLKKITLNGKKTVPEIENKAFGKTSNIRFIVKNKKTSKLLKAELKQSGLAKDNYKVRIKK